MRVYLMRHGHAVPQSFEVSDDMRWLTVVGREVSLRVGTLLHDKGIQIDAMFTSPLVRAVQTAELFSTGAGYAGEIRSMDALRPDGFPRGLADEIRSVGVSVALVGHEPSMAALGAYLCGKDRFPSFRRGEVVMVEGGRPRWRIVPDSLSIEPIS